MPKVTTPATDKGARARERARKRRYRLRKRAEKLAETRRRIVEAAVELHGTLGPSRTTMSAIAALAGVQRNTLYSHFPDEMAVGQACSRLWYERNPRPDVEDLRRISDPRERLRAALRETHAFFARTHQMLANLARDIDHPGIWEATALLRADTEACRDAVVQAFQARGARRKRLQAAAELALAFESWRTLVQRRGLAPNTAVELLARMVETAAEPTAPRGAGGPRRGGVADTR